LRILGIDPGLLITGYGVVDFDAATPRLIDGGVIRLSARTSLPARLVELERELLGVIEEHRPAVAAVEQVYSHYKHPRTAVLMAHARGVILLAACRAGLKLHQYAANRIKLSLTGHGHAKKGQVQRAIQSLWSLPAPPEPADVADALAIALHCGRNLATGGSSR